MSRCKIALIGEVSAGKTTLAHYLSLNEFFESRSSTIGAAFHPIKHDNKNFELWDTSGQEKFSTLTSLYYRNASIILLVFDANNYQYENKLKYYLEETKLKVDDGNNYRIIIICNKIDLVNKSQLVSLKKRVDEIIVETNSKEHVAEYLEMSCKKKIGRDELLAKIVAIRNEQLGQKQQLESDYFTFNKKDKEKNKNIILLDSDEEYRKSKTQGCCF